MEIYIENILYSKKVKSLNFLIGARFSGYIFADAYYDYTKLMHGLLVSFEMVVKINIK